MFSTLPRTNSNFLLGFIVSSSSAVYLDWSKILSFDKGLNSRPVDQKLMFVFSLYCLLSVRHNEQSCVKIH